MIARPRPTTAPTATSVVADSNPTYHRFWIRFADGTNFQSKLGELQGLGFDLFKEFQGMEPAGWFEIDDRKMDVLQATLIVKGVGDVECVEKYDPQERVYKAVILDGRL